MRALQAPSHPQVSIIHTENYTKMAILTKDDYLQLSSHFINKPV